MKKIFLNIYICCLVFLVFSLDVSAESIIAIDPGHGGSNLGADYLVETNSDILEKDLTLKLAFYLKDDLEKHQGIKVVLLRNSDIDLSLRERADLASDSNAEFIVSLHFNASEQHQYYGTEIWVSAQKKYYEGSYALAQNIESKLMELGLNSRGIKTRLSQTNTADYYGIIREGTERGINTIIVEHCFLDNQHDENFWETSESLKKLAEADAKGILTYIDNDYPKISLDNSSFGVKPDTTPPTIGNISFESISEEKMVIHLQVEEPESRLSYYTYSFNQGMTWENLISLTENNCMLEIPRNSVATNIKFRVYNGYDLYSESDLITIPDFEKEDVAGRIEQFSHVDLENYKIEIKLFCMIFSAILLMLLVVHAALNMILRLQNWWIIYFFGLDSHKVLEKKDNGKTDIFSLIWNELGIEERRDSKLFFYTKIQHVWCQIDIKDACLNYNEIKGICEEYVLKINEKKELPVDGLQLILNQIAAFDYMIKNWSSPLTKDFCQRLFQLLTINLEQSKECPKNAFEELEEKIRKITERDMYLLIDLNQSTVNQNYGNDDLENLLEIYQSIIEILGNGNTFSYSFAGLVIFKECICNCISPFIVDSQAVFNIISKSSKLADKRNALQELFYKKQAEYIQIAMMLIQA